MAEPFSAIAGAVSIVDVVIRTSNTVYDSLCYLKDAQGLTQELRQKVQIIQSILQDLKVRVARYRQSQVYLPDAVSLEIVAIKTDLDILSSLLPATHSTRRIQTWLKLMRDRRKVEELVLKLQQHQISLIWALQSPLLQMAANSCENVLILSEESGRRHLNTKAEIKADISTMGIELHDALRALDQKAQESSAKQEYLKELLDSQNLSHNENQVRIMNEIHEFRSSLSDISSLVRSYITVRVPTEAVPRVVRAELLRVLKPIMEQYFNTFKANTDDQSRTMLKKPDEMAEYFGQELLETSHSCSSRASHLRSDPAIDKKCIQDDPGATGLLEPAQMRYESFMVPERPNEFLARRSKQWRRSMVTKWPIGTLRVTVTSTHTTSNVSYVGEIPQPQATYRITIEFQPAQNLITLRGLTLSLAHIQDQRGHYQVCPLLATFAVVPEYADVMIFARKNDVAGLQSLFERRLAAPSDRDEEGETPLMKAAFEGASDACRFLLAMGADPLVTNNDGKGLFLYTNLGFFCSHLLHRDLSIAYESYTSVLRPLQSLAIDLVEDSYFEFDTYSEFNPFIMPGMFFMKREPEADLDPEQIEIFFNYIRFLKKGGFTVNRTSDGRTTLLHHLCYFILQDDQKQIKDMELALRVALELGGDISAFDELGVRPLSYIFILGGMHSKDSRSIIELAKLLLQYGADPCDLDLDGLSPLETAHSVGMLVEFLKALKQSGFDVWEVVEETLRRQSIFFDGHGESTTVDNEDIAPPSTEGLSKRRVVTREKDED